jgi:hypothetical protein
LSQPGQAAGKEKKGFWVGRNRPVVSGRIVEVTDKKGGRLNRKVLIAALVGGIVVFAWGALSHMALGLGEVGVKWLPNQETVLPALKTGVPDPGLYLFPYSEDPAQWEAAYRDGPHGLLVVGPKGELAMGRRMGLELLTDVLGAFLLAWVASRLAGSMGWARGAALGAVLGLFAHIGIDASYSIWYDFPWKYALGQGVDHLVGWSLGGAAIGALLRRA